MTTGSGDTEAPRPAADAWTVRRVLEWTTGHLQKHGSDTPRLDAEILLAQAMKCRRIQLYTNYDEVLSDAIRAEMRGLVQRRAQREPVAYLVGHREFFSLDFRVTPDVLIPRPDTETLVVEALSRLKPLPESRVLDLCTGSGCVAVALAKNVKTARVVATDLSPAALAIARENADKNGVAERIDFFEGDLFAALPSIEPFDVIVSNPPYIPSGELETLDDDVRKYEPRLALEGGGDGLTYLRRIVVDAPRWLKLEGTLLLEHAADQAAAVAGLMESTQRYDDIGTVKDLGTQPRVTWGRLRPG